MGETDIANKMKNLINRFQLKVVSVYLLGVVTGVAFLYSYNLYQVLCSSDKLVF